MHRVSLIVAVALTIVAVDSRSATAQLVIRAIGGTATEDTYGVGLGASVGFELPVGSKGMFIGARGTYHLGKDLSLAGGFSSETGLLIYGVEFGSAIVTRPILIRSAGLLGVASTSVKNLTGGSVISKLTNNKFVFGPGLLIAVPIGPTHLGVEPRYLRVFGGKSSFAVYGSFSINVDLTP